MSNSRTSPKAPVVHVSIICYTLQLNSCTNKMIYSQKAGQNIVKKRTKTKKKNMLHSNKDCLGLCWSVNNAAEANSACTLVRIAEQEILVVMVELSCLGKIPKAALRVVV